MAVTSPLGTHRIYSSGLTTGTVSAYTGEFTVCDKGYVTTTAKIRSVIISGSTNSSQVGSFSGKAVIYNEAGQKLAEGPVTTHNLVGGEIYELPFSGDGYTLQANVPYYIGFYTPSGLSGYPAVRSTSSANPTISRATNPALTNWVFTRNAQFYATSNSFPTLPSGGNDYIIEGGMTFSTMNVAPTVAITNQPNQIVKAGQNFTVTWQYSDPDGNSQNQYMIELYRNGTLILDDGEGAPDVYSYTIPGSLYITGDATYEFKVKVMDSAGAWSNVASYTFESTTWTMLSEVNSSAPSGYIDAKNLEAGTYEIRVRANDGNGWSEWSDIKTQVLGPASNVYVMENGTVKVAVKYVMVDGVLKATGPTMVAP